RSCWRWWLPPNQRRRRSSRCCTRSTERTEQARSAFWSGMRLEICTGLPLRVGKGICSNYGCGTAFKLDKNGSLIWLHSFNSKDGREPLAGLLRNGAGNLYGTAVEGGAGTKVCGGAGIGCGVVFKLDAAGEETVLHKFKGTPDG